MKTPEVPDFESGDKPDADQHSVDREIVLASISLILQIYQAVEVPAEGKLALIKRILESQRDPYAPPTDKPDTDDLDLLKRLRSFVDQLEASPQFSAARGGRL